ncbi:PAS domain-containing sensor histidine kinase [Arenibacter sp. S6351L]|uniref:PAS domain-containing sensor histidine kinase n=1 Tax=Arenibacter sp. S6351L TaxID=2926407 RepID=UPI001FF3489C|nr:PAS domain-containing sensor histidine kinase [Arenibacter sp. S6351L]MCK0136055.1 PAS domain-containing sensor histidine kinase [Arenibacter sp. S6351L]
MEKNLQDNSDKLYPWNNFQQVDVNRDIYKQIFKYSIFPKIVHDADMCIIDANSSAIKEFGFSRNELLKKKINDLQCSCDLEHSVEGLEEKRKKKPSSEKKYKRKDGSVFIAEVTPRSYLVGDKPVVHVHIQNITERKRAEENIKELNKALEAEITNVELNAKQIEIKNKEFEEFAYVTAHDLKATVTNLHLLIDMIKTDSIISDVNVDLFNKLKIGIEQVRKTVFTLNDVINFKTTLKDKKERLEFKKVFEEISQGLTEDLNTTNTILDVDFSECTEIDYPPLHLKSVMQNLLANAVNYKSPDRSLEIKVKTCEVRGNVCLTVWDNGIGFDDEKYGEKVFGLIKRLHTHVEGKGVGLYMVKSIVEAHGGRITVKSKPNEGAMFTIQFSN